MWSRCKGRRDLQMAIWVREVWKHLWGCWLFSGQTTDHKWDWDHGANFSVAPGVSFSQKRLRAAPLTAPHTLVCPSANRFDGGSPETLSGPGQPSLRESNSLMPAVALLLLTSPSFTGAFKDNTCSGALNREFNPLHLVFIYLYYTTHVKFRL